MLVFAKAVFYVSSLLFSIYINGLVDELKKSSCGVDLECGGEVIPGL